MSKRVILLASLALVLTGALAACGARSLPQAAPPLEGVSTEVTKVVEAGQANASGDALQLPGGRAQVERMIIWTADIVLTVKDSKQAIGDVLAAARELGGYVVNTESWLDNDLLYARLTVRVPADKFEEAMAGLRDMGLKVERESANSDDVTEEYVDLEARLRALGAKEAQLTKLMDQAEDTEAVLAVYERLSATQTEIEQVKGRMSYLEKLSAMATITVTLNPEQPERPVVEEGWRPLSTVRNAARSLVGTLQGLGNVVIWFIVYVLPVLLVIVAPIAILLLVIRLLLRRKRSKAASTQG